MTRRRATTALILALGLLGGAIGLRAWCIDKVEQTLKQRGMRWSERQDALLAARWIGLESPKGSAEQLSVRAGWPVSVKVKSPIIDLKQFEVGGPAGPARKSSLPVSVRVEDLTVRWGNRVLLSGLSGPLQPEPNLVGPDGTLSLETSPTGTAILVGTATMDLNLPEIQGRAKVSVRAGEQVHLEVQIVNAVLAHPLIASKPLPKLPLWIAADWTPDSDAIEIQGKLGTVDFSATGTVQPASRTLAVDVKVPATSLTSVVKLFGETIPEARGSSLRGSLALEARVEGPPWVVDPAPVAKELGARGVLKDGFRKQRVQWQARDADGHPVFRQTGPTHPGWTPLADAGFMPAAVVAAEDGAFHTHPGYDLAAIREALAQARKGERLRGGSTLTQQLAKNLFLSGERTLARKLRELLYALDLERSLPKPAILALYLNVVEFGPGIHGLRAASDAYFLKQPSGLSLHEAAWLAGILPGPRTAYARARKGKARRARMKTILDRMAARGVISEAQRDRAKATPLRFVVE